MAKKDKEQLADIPETMEDYMLQQLKKTVILKDGNTLKDPHDGHELTAEEAIAHIRAPFTQGGGLRRGCGKMVGHLGKILAKKSVRVWPPTN